MCTPPFLYFFYFFVYVCVFFFPCVCVCASRSPGATEKSTHREDELYIESAPLAEILSNVCQTLPNSKKSTQIGDLSMRLPKNLHRLVTYPCDFPSKHTI